MTFYSIWVICIPSNNTPQFQVLWVLGISCYSPVPSVCQIYILSEPLITQVCSVCWALSLLWSVGRVQETSSEFLSPIMERIKTRRTLGKKLGQPHGTRGFRSMLPGFVALTLWQGTRSCGDHTVAESHLSHGG